ncbi:MAG: phage terminase large subunit [Patescibacteria group bacterium]|nr:phage terminase large subunit [Patescibacteria group bacterium]
MAEINKEQVEEMIRDRKSRVAVTNDSHLWFFSVYFNHYMFYPFADFHYKMFNITEDETINTALIMAFRGSAKSTIFTLSYPIWSILGKPQKKFVIILGQTQRQARQHLINIRKELEGNELLRADLGPFQQIEDEWGSMSLVIPKYEARITAASMEQTIRGMKHMQYRPDLIICDDIEDLQSVKTKEGRDKIHQWISGEVIPAGDKSTKIIFVGNLLHEDSLLMRIKEKIEAGEMNARLLTVPLIDEANQITWTGKFKNMDEIEIERKKIANESSWQREYLLRIISDQERVVHPEWIHYYDEIPNDYETQTKEDRFRFHGTGIDLAISEKESADYTAMVSAEMFGAEEFFRIYILPNPLNQRLTFPKTVETVRELIELNSSYKKNRIFIEGVGYQQALIQLLQKDIDNVYKTWGEPKRLKIEDYIPKGDKRARLAAISPYIQNGKILFPKHGAEELINQMVNFGKEKHDDLVDAFTCLTTKMIHRDHTLYIDSPVIIIGEDDDEYPQDVVCD